ncbi:MAG: hypothetical protein R6U27_03755, partial [Desulfobacterales bacterium]
LSVEDRLKMVYQDIKNDLGKDDLQLLDMLYNAYDIDPYVYLKKFGSWLRAKKFCENGNISQFENDLLGSRGEDFLAHIEIGMKPVRSYKMVVLLSLLELEGTSWRIEDIAREFLSHYLNHQDHIFDYDALARSSDPEDYRLSSVIAHLKKMPLDKLSNAPEDCFVLDSSNNVFRLKPEYESFWKRTSFRNLVKDRAEFLLARYFMRARLQQIIYYSPSIIREGFKINRKFVDEFFADNPPEPGEKREITIFADNKKFKAYLFRNARDNEYRVSYDEKGRFAEFFQNVFAAPPETGEKAFTLVAEKNNLRLELPQKIVDLRGMVVDIPYAKNPDTGITARFRELLRKTADQTEWEMLFEKPGYEGSMEIEIEDGDAFRAWAGAKFRDKSRFPARIKAAATALLHEGFRGEFSVEAKGKRVLINQLSK